MAWGKNGTPNTISGGAVNNIDVNDLDARKFNQILYHVIGQGGTANTTFRVSSDSGNNYSSRESGNGGADGTHLNDDELPTIQFSAHTEFIIGYMCNISGEEKLFLMFTIDQGTAGAENFPYRRELAGKHVTTTGQITDVEWFDGVGSTIANDSNLSVLGSDFTIAPPTVQNGAVFEETDTNKHYLLDDGTWTEI